MAGALVNDHVAGFASGLGCAGLLVLLGRVSGGTVPTAEIMLILAAVVLIPVGIIDFVSDRLDRKRG